MSYSMYCYKSPVAVCLIHFSRHQYSFTVFCFHPPSPCPSFSFVLISKFYSLVVICRYLTIHIFVPSCHPQAVQALTHMGTASGVEGQVTGPKIAGPPASTPALSASTRQPPLPQPPPLQTLQEPDVRESDIHEEYDKFTDVLQVLNRFEIDEDPARNNNVKGNLKKNLEFWVFLGASSFILNVI